jgi:hypothetical protein
LPTFRSKQHPQTNSTKPNLTESKKNSESQEKKERKRERKKKHRGLEFYKKKFVEEKKTHAHNRPGSLPTLPQICVYAVHDDARRDAPPIEPKKKKDSEDTSPAITINQSIKSDLRLARGRAFQ